MNCAPSRGCFASRNRKKASAGGQLEHPSEVKSSTTMGVLEAAGVAALAWPAGTAIARASAIAPNPYPRRTFVRGRIVISSSLPWHISIATLPARHMTTIDRGSFIRKYRFPGACGNQGKLTTLQENHTEEVTKCIS